MSGESKQELRAAADNTPGTTRYPDADINDLDEISNHGTWNDESRQSVWERIKENKLRTAAIGIPGFFILIAFTGFFWSYGPSVLRSPIMWGVIGTFTVLALTYLAGMRKMRARISNSSTLVINKPNTSNDFDCEIEKDANGDGYLVYPVSGYTTILHRPQYYSVGDFGDKYLRGYTKQGKDPGDRATIGVPEELASVDLTEKGTTVVVDTQGLKIDTYGRNHDMYPELPATVDESTLRDLNEKMEESWAEKKRLEQAVENKEIQIGKLQSNDTETRREIEDRVWEKYKPLIEAGLAQRRGGDGGSRAPYYEDLEERIDGDDS